MEAISSRTSCLDSIRRSFFCPRRSAGASLALKLYPGSFQNENLGFGQRLALEYQGLGQTCLSTLQYTIRMRRSAANSPQCSIFPGGHSGRSPLGATPGVHLGSSPAAPGASRRSSGGGGSLLWEPSGRPPREGPAPRGRSGRPVLRAAGGRLETAWSWVGCLVLLWTRLGFHLHSLSA